MKKLGIIFIIIVGLFAQKIINPVTSTLPLTKGTVVTITGASQVEACDASERPAGIIQVVEDVSGTNYYHIVNSGIVPNITFATAATAGDQLVTADGGQVQLHTALTEDNYVVGIALETVSAGGTGKIMVQAAKESGPASPLGSNLTSTFIWVGDASNEAHEVEVTGDLTLASDGVVEIIPDIVSSINSVTNDEGNIELIAGGNISITPDDALNQITFEVEGLDNYQYWGITADGGITTQNIGSEDILSLSVAEDLVISRTDYNVEISHANSGFASSVDNSGTTFLQDITINSNGHITGHSSVDVASVLSQIWTDNTDFVSPDFTTYGLTFPYIYDDNTTIENNGNAAQFYMETSGANTEAGIYVYSNPASTLDKSSWLYGISRSLIKAYDEHGDAYNSSISGYSNLTSNNSAAIIGYGTNSDQYTLLATKLPTYSGSATNSDYAAMMKGDFYNQGAEGAVTNTSMSGTWTDLQTVTITTHGTGTDYSRVMINASATLQTPMAWTSASNDRWGEVYIRVVRDGTNVIGSAMAMVGFADDYWLHGGMSSLSIATYDDPVDGSHEYKLQYLTGYGLTVTSPSSESGLVVFELKR